MLSINRNLLFFQYLVSSLAELNTTFAFHSLSERTIWFCSFIFVSAILSKGWLFFLIVCVMPILCCHHWFFFSYLISSDAMVLQEYLVERECQRFQCLFSHLRLQFAFPNGDGVPAHRSQLMLYLQVSLLIPPYLGYPEIPIRLRYFTALWVLNRKL